MYNIERVQPARRKYCIEISHFISMPFQLAVGSMVITEILLYVCTNMIDYHRPRLSAPRVLMAHILFYSLPEQEEPSQRRRLDLDRTLRPPPLDVRPCLCICIRHTLVIEEGHTM
jgi:hypothetical protein